MNKVHSLVNLGIYEYYVYIVHKYVVEIGDIFMVMDLLEPKILFYNQIDSKLLLPIYF